MRTAYSVAEARDQFAALIHQVEAHKQPIQVTRRGEPVAVILAQGEYERLQERLRSSPALWQAYLDWREEWGVDEWEDDIDPFADVRDRSPVPERNLWE